MLFGFTFERIEKFLYGLWSRIIRRELVAKELCKLRNVTYFRRVRLGVNAIEKRSLAAIFCFAGNNFSDRPVRGEHKILDHAHRTKPLLAYRFNRLTVLEPKFEFLRFEVDRTRFASTLVHLLT